MFILPIEVFQFPSLTARLNFVDDLWEKDEDMIQKEGRGGEDEDVETKEEE